MKKIRHILIVTIGFMLLGLRVFSQGITPHIHVQVMVGGKWVDPTPYFFGR